MNIHYCCDTLKDFVQCRHVDISYTNEMVYVGDAFSNFRMKYCPFCGKEIRFEE
jgi:hypothetical protein